MRKFTVFTVLACVICAVCFVGSAFAETIGPMNSKEGLTLGVGYSHYSREIQDETFTSSQEYISVDYTIKGWQPYLRIGNSGLRIKNGFGETWGDFKDNSGIFGTIGLKKALYQHSQWTVGAFGQISFFNDYNDQKSGLDGTTPVTVDIKVGDYKEAKIGAIVQRAFGITKIYAAPFYQWMDGKVSGIRTTPTGIVVESDDIKSDDDFGGFVGAVVGLGKSFELNLEVQQTSKTSIATAFTYRF